MKLEHSLTPYKNINSKWIKDLNVRLDTVKLSEENIGRKLSHMNHSTTFLDATPRAMKIKTKWDLIKLKSYCTAVTEQSFRLCGRRRGWDVSREQH